MKNENETFKTFHRKMLQSLLTFVGLLADSSRDGAAHSFLTLDDRSFYEALDPDRSLEDVVDDILDDDKHEFYERFSIMPVLWGLKNIVYTLERFTDFSPRIAKVIKGYLLRTVAVINSPEDVRWLCDQIWHCLCNERILYCHMLELNAKSNDSRHASLAYLGDMIESLWIMCDDNKIKCDSVKDWEAQ